MKTLLNSVFCNCKDKKTQHANKINGDSYIIYNMKSGDDFWFRYRGTKEKEAGGGAD